MNSDVPKMNKKSRPDLRNPKRDIKMFKNGKIAERGFFGARNFERQKVLTGASRLGYRHTLGSLFSKFFLKKVFFEIFSWVSVGIEVVVLLF